MAGPRTEGWFLCPSLRAKTSVLRRFREALQPFTAKQSILGSPPRGFVGPAVSSDRRVVNRRSLLCLRLGGLVGRFVLVVVVDVGVDLGLVEVVFLVLGDRALGAGLVLLLGESGELGGVGGLAGLLCLAHDSRLGRDDHDHAA